MKNIQNIKYVVKKRSLAFGFYFILYFMSVCIYEGAICMYMLMDECGDQGSDSGIFLQELANCFREIGFLTGLYFTNCNQLAGFQLLLPQRQDGICASPSACLAFYVGADNQTQVLVFALHAPYTLRFYSGPSIQILKKDSRVSVTILYNEFS